MRMHIGGALEVRGTLGVINTLVRLAHGVQDYLGAGKTHSCLRNNVVVLFVHCDAHISLGVCMVRFCKWQMFGC